MSETENIILTKKDLLKLIASQLVYYGYNDLGLQVNNLTSTINDLIEKKEEIIDNTIVKEEEKEETIAGNENKEEIMEDVVENKEETMEDVENKEEETITEVVESKKEEENMADIIENKKEESIDDDDNVTFKKESDQLQLTLTEFINFDSMDDNNSNNSGDVYTFDASDQLYQLASKGKLFNQRKLNNLMYLPPPFIHQSNPLENERIKKFEIEKESEILKKEEEEENEEDDEIDGLNMDLGRSNEEIELAQHSVYYTTAHKAQARCASFSSDGNYLATGSADTSLKVIEVPKIKLRNDDDKPLVRALYDHTAPVNDVIFHPNGQVLASGSDDCCVKLFDLSKLTVKKSFRYLQDSHPVKSLAFHPTGDFLAVGTEHEKLRVYDIKTFQAFTPNTPQSSHHSQGLTQVKYSSDGKLLMTSSLDGSIKVWDGRNGTLVRTLEKVHQGAPIASIQFSSNNKYILSSGLDSIVKLSEVGSGKLVKEYFGARLSWLGTATFTQDEMHILTMTSDPGHGIKAWHTHTARPAHFFPTVPYTNPQPILKLIMAPDGQGFVTASEDSRVRYWGKS